MSVSTSVLSLAVGSEEEMTTFSSEVSMFSVTSVVGG
jgi:hypothetical protein